MTIKNVSDALEILCNMNCEQREGLAYFAMGMLYAFTVVEPGYVDVDIAELKGEMNYGKES